MRWLWVRLRSALEWFGALRLEFVDSLLLVHFGDAIQQLVELDSPTLVATWCSAESGFDVNGLRCAGSQVYSRKIAR